MARRHPPLPTEARPVFWVLRTIGLLIGLSGLYLAAVAAQKRAWSIMVATLFLGGGFFALMWMHPLSAWFLPTVVGLSVVVAFILRSWAIAAILAAFVALLAWSRLRPFARAGSRLDPDKIAIAEPGAVMKNARAFVDEFKAAGFEQVGALRYSVGRVEVVESLLLSPDGFSYAAVTDSILHLASRFPEGRELLTRNSNRIPLPDYFLINSVAGGGPTELMTSHRGALALVAERGHEPVPTMAPDLARLVLDGERAAIAWTNANRQAASSFAGRRPLSVRPGRHEEIDAWLRAGGLEP